MDTGDIALVATLTVGFVAILIAQFALMRQGNSEVRELRAEVRETRDKTTAEIHATRDKTTAEIRDLSDRLGTRISDAEREQARLEGANGTLAEVLKQQSHTHDAPAD